MASKEEPVKITRYKCCYCKKHFSSKNYCKEHIFYCCYNKRTKSCYTCNNRKVKQNVWYCIYYKKVLENNLKEDNDFMNLQKDCNCWRNKK